MDAPRPTLPWKAVALFAALFGLTLLGYHQDLLSPLLRSDESIHATAIDLARQGRSPYEHPPYLGTPAFASAFGALARHTGLLPVVLLLRALNLLAVAGLAWIASGRAALSMRWRWGLALGLALAAPPFLDAIGAGNLSPLAHVLTLLALGLWRTRPLLAGTTLGLGLAIKPYALLLIPLYLCARLRRPTPATFAFPAMAAMVLSGTLLAFPSGTLRMLAQHEGFAVSLRSVSLQRTLFCLVGWGPGALLVLLTVGLAALLVLRRQPRTDSEFATLALFACVLGTTRIWVHVLAPLLPSLVEGFAGRLRQLRAAWRSPAPERSRAGLGLLGLAIPTLLVFTGDNWVALTLPFPGLPVWADGLLASLPLAALFVLPRLLLGRAGHRHD